MSAKFYFYPDDTGGLTAITLAKPLTELHEKRVPQRVTAKRGDGSAAVASWLSDTRVRIVLERGLSAGNVRDLKAMEDHLHRGGAVGFAREHTKAWAAYGSSTYRGYTYISTGGQAFANWEASGALASGDEIVIESAPPEAGIEMHAISSVSATTGQVNLSSETILRSLSGPILVRHRDFYPALRLPDDQLDKPLVTTERRLSWTLDVELEVIPDIIAIGYEQSTGVIGLSLSPTDGLNGASISLGTLLAAGAASNSASIGPPGPGRSQWQQRAANFGRNTGVL